MFKYLFIFFLIQSCSLKSIVKYVEVKKENIEKVEKEDLTCPIKERPISIYGVHPFIEEKILKVIKANRLNFEESIYLLSYYQLYLRPDSTSINSRTLHVFKNFKREGKTLYIPNDSNSYLSYLNDKLTARSSINQRRITRAINQLPKRIPVTSHMQKFISERKSQFYNDKSLKKYFFRGNQVIKKDESFPFVKTWLNIKNNRDKDTQKINFLFENSNDFMCSYDERLYLDGPKFQRKQVRANAHLFGIFLSEDQYFFTMTSSSPQEQIKKNSYLFKSKNLETFNGAFCLNTKEKKLIYSINNIHSEQLLNNLIYKRKTISKDIINSKRYLKLLYPNRNIIEIYGRDQLDQSLKDEINTIYTTTIGKVNVINIGVSPAIAYEDPRRELLKCE